MGGGQRKVEWGCQEKVSQRTERMLELNLEGECLSICTEHLEAVGVA